MKRLLKDIDVLITRFLSYSQSERRGVSVVAIVLLGLWVYKANITPPALDKSYLAHIDSVNKEQRAQYFAKTATLRYSKPKFTYTNNYASSPKKSVYIELNSADSAAIRSVVGVGEVITKSIISYRNRLGGFVELSQLKEVYGITDINFEQISKQFYVDSTIIKKIDVNFAPAYVLSSHPYISKNMADRVVKGRNLKGGWKNIRELIDRDILLPDEAHRVARYLVFN